jgi:peptidoglycan/LPS O-acetylase OafA/YrhL
MSAITVAAGVVFLTASARSDFALKGSPQIDIVLAPLFWALAVTAIAASALLLNSMTRCLGRWRDSIRTIGLMTYPLYLLHQVLGLKLMVILGPLIGPRLALLAALLFAVALSFGVVHAEKSLRRRLADSITRLFSARGSSLRGP